MISKIQNNEEEGVIMVKKTFKTLKENPTIVIGFAIFFALTLLLLIPAFFGKNNLFSHMMNMSIFYKSGIRAQITFWENYKSILIIGAIMYVLLGIFYLPPLFNRVYEVCSGRKEKGWIKRGLKKNWWRIITITIIVCVIAIFINMIMVFFMSVPFLGFFVYVFVLLWVTTYLFIAYTATIVEKDFKQGLNDIFSVGSRIFKKEFWTVCLTTLPVLLASTGMTIYVIMQVIGYTSNHRTDLQMIQFIQRSITVYQIFTLIFIAYCIFAGAFLFTYTMHQYLAAKYISISKDKPKEAE